MNHVLVSLASPFYIYILSVHAKICTCIVFTLYINNTQLYIIIMQGSKLKLQLIQSGNATNFFGLATKEFMFVAKSVDLFQEFSEVGVALIKLSVHFSNQAQKHSCRVGVSPCQVSQNYAEMSKYTIIQNLKPIPWNQALVNY